VTLKHAAQVNGMTGIAFTRIDTLSGLPKVKVCTHYMLDSKPITSQRASYLQLERCRPVYREFSGWKDPGEAEWKRIAKKGYKALPKQARAYLEYVSKSIGVPIYVVSVGPARDDTIVLKDVFRKK
jgi:adenylosuccinate synthase